MALRISLFSPMRQLINRQQHLNKLSSHLVSEASIYSDCCWNANSSRLLHIKAYDKDADFDKLREANRLRKDNILFEQLSSDVYVENDNLNQGVHQSKHLESNSLENVKREVDLLEQEDADTFGSTSPDTHDDGDVIEEEYISNPPIKSKKLLVHQYARLIKEQLQNNQLKAAIDILEVRMLKEDRAKPDHYIYNLLISGCARAGYTRKAFSLFTKMRQRGLRVRESTYTSLFNACANAPSADDGLVRAERLRAKLVEKGYQPNVKNYNAMIKAFGRWGDVKTAYLLADEMLEKQLPFTGETANFLLQACASDYKFGFRHCILTWHKMLQGNIKPDYYTFFTILRCVRDCGFGGIEEMQHVIQHVLDKQQNSPQIGFNTNETILQLQSTEPEDSKVERSKTTTNGELTTQQDVLLQQNTGATSAQQIDMDLPNLLAPRPHIGNLISLSEVHQPHERFLLLGGLSGFLNLMKSYGITPNIQTFTIMLEVIPPTRSSEKQLLTFIRKIGLKADIDFFNILIKKRAMRLDYEGGKEVLTMIKTARLYPDIVTYGVLALGCTTIENARELLQQMHHHEIRMNIQILGAMLRQGCVRNDFNYISEILQISLDEHIKPNPMFLKHLYKFYKKSIQAIDSRHPRTKVGNFRENHHKFCKKYRLYQEEHGILDLNLEDAIKKIQERPYQQYQEETINGIEPLKNEKLARKQKLRKRIKRIKIRTLRGDDEETDTPVAALLDQNKK